jgi:hypothetical protein
MNLAEKIKRNQTPLLILLLTILTGFLVIIAIAPKRPTLTPPPSEKQEIVTPAETILSFESASLPTAAVQSVNVVADSGTNKITGVQLELSFDPKLISGVTVTSGNLIPEPVELLNKVDATNGRITYVIGVPIGGSGVQGKGTVATISYNEIGAKGTLSEIKFLPKTLVAIEGFSATALKSSFDYSKIIGEAASPSAQ